MSRDYAIRNILTEAIDRMEMLVDPIELWVIVALAPELGYVLEDKDVETISIELGQYTRNERTELLQDRMIMNTPTNGKSIIPYDAIYCMVTEGIYAGMLDWQKTTEGGKDLAYVNLVMPDHGIPKYHN